MAHVFFDRLEDRRSTQVLWGGYSAPGNYYSAYGLQTGTYQDYSPYTSAVNAYHAALGPYNPYYFPWNPPYYPSGYYPSYNQYPYWYNTSGPYPQWNLWGRVGNWFSPVWNMFQGWFAGWNPYGTWGQQSEQPMSVMDRIENAIIRALNNPAKI